MFAPADHLRTCALLAAIVAVEVRTALRVHGAVGTVTRSFRHARDLLSLRRGDRHARSVPDGFDRTHGVHTRVAMNLRELYEVKRRGGEEHTPTPAAVLRNGLASLDIPFEQTVFVDFGSGAGRALLVAAELPFKAIIGVELCESLHQRAQDNVADYRNPAQRCHDIYLHCGDATEFTLPPDPLAIYFYNPFRDDVMRRVLGSIEQSLREIPRPITIVHLWPRADTRALFERSDALTPVEHGPDLTIYRSLVRPAPHTP